MAQGQNLTLAGGTGQPAFHPADAFGQRRALLHRLEAGQKEEHQVLAQIAQAARSCKRDLLLRLSHWLLALPADRVTASERAEMEKLGGVSLSEWDALQRGADDLARQLKTARVEEQRAQREYEATAPLGRVSGWFVQGAPKAHIEELRARQRQAVAARERLETEARQNTARRQALGERFLRGCLRDLNALARTKAVGPDVAQRLHQLSQESGRLWNAHAAAQRRTADELARHVASLRRHYDGREAPDGREQ